jgi:hypothetical protein
MANKENRPPPSPRNGMVFDYGDSTPPGSTSTALGLRPWHTSAFASPPFRAISPNSKPALNQQRDHSACRRPDSPLKVRKTRENLKLDSLYTDVAPPCLHLDPQQHTADCAQSLQTNVGESTSARSSRLGHHAYGYSEACASSLPSLPPFHPEDYPRNVQLPARLADPIPPRMHRHKSVSRRMLSKVKQGIVSRSRASPIIRPIESETSLMRRISGRRKQSVEVDRRAQSFELSRDSVSTVPGSGIQEEIIDHYAQQRSATCSTVSTSQIMDELPLTPSYLVNRTPQQQLSPEPASDATSAHDISPGHTPRPQRKTTLWQTADSAHLLRMGVPHVNLVVNLERNAVDSASEQAIWVAVEAYVCTRPCAVDTHDPESAALDDESTDHTGSALGTITSLRLCYKPTNDCTILDIVGQKALKNLVHGQTCCLFIRVHVPKVRACSAIYAEDDQASLFTELESLMGILETELLHLEARFRHSLLPRDNVVAVRHVVKIQRPKMESRWSIASLSDDLHAAEQVHTKLAIHLADHYPPVKALQLIDRYLAAELSREEPIQQIRQTVANELLRAQAAENDLEYGADKPSVVITDIDLDSSLASAPASLEHLSTTEPCTPRAHEHPHASISSTTTAPHPVPPRIRSISLNTFAIPPRKPLNTSATNANLPNRSNTSLPSTAEETPETTDAARKVWRHIRRSSLTPSQQQQQQLQIQPPVAAAATSSQVDLLHQDLESDAALMELRRKALANKRSVGAETLMAWKWDTRRERLRERGELPWM